MVRSGRFDIVLQVRRGECVGLHGPNGSGKSMLLKMILNVTYPTRGTVAVKGRVAPIIEFLVPVCIRT